MGWVICNSALIEYKVPPTNARFFPQEIEYELPSESDPDGEACLESAIWTSCTISSDWTWKPLSELGRFLINSLKMYLSLSQTRSDVQMVQSLVPIWKEHQERTGIYEFRMPPDSGKPLPEHVLKNLSAGFVYYEKKILELCSEAVSKLTGKLCVMKPYENPLDVNTASGMFLQNQEGDLLPDTWFVAINIVALGFQNDSDTIIQVLVLLSFDALLGCKVLVKTHEKDLLKKITYNLSRSPSESSIASEDTRTCEEDILEPAIPHISSADDCVQETSIIEDLCGTNT
ncbi:DNA polymerase zeta catalytic subunit [Senna tora]|uniref:DNA polymerase zeta catalytic subunit n=1 Tax=Senna tora TaxID=362788 RepID=A0A834TA53_9FABA|nr:DNA polymerase zeta catalytic subunit [Senna tora]